MGTSIYRVGARTHRVMHVGGNRLNLVQVRHGKRNYLCEC